MTRELIIEGEHVDLSSDTHITLEFVSNLVGDLGKINLSHSYTVKLPRTTRNTRILDAPDRPAHASGLTRRFLNARYIQNGVDLIGPARAYILQTTPEAYEIALIWNTLSALQELSESDATLNDLPDLPVLPWLGSNGLTPEYNGASEETTGAFFAQYNSGLGANIPALTKTSSHPCMRVSNLIERILSNARVPFSISTKAQESIGYKVVLAAPSHKPNSEMERKSGSIASVVRLGKGTYNGQPHQFFYIQEWTDGWDSLRDFETGGADFNVEGTDKGHVLLNWRMPDAFSDSAIVVTGYQYDGPLLTGSEDLLRVAVKTDASGCYVFADEDISFNNWPHCAISLKYSGSELFTEELTAYNASLPLAAFYRHHKTIDITQDNRFPLEGNLPDIKQWDFIKAIMALCGIAPIIQNGTLYLYTYAELLSNREAYDWTSKIDITQGAPDVLKYSLSGWAQHNLITFKDNSELIYDPTADMIVNDTTIKTERKWFELPFAASRQRSALHYKVTKEDDGTIEVEDLDMEPRVFDSDFAGLVFRESMQGAELITTNYTELQTIVRAPVVLTLKIRLHEIDLATLDLSRPVYLQQYGRYYGILNIQTSDTDLCKVELIQ